MIWIDKNQFKETYAVLKKQKILEPIFVELKQFVEKEYGITIYNITYKQIFGGFFNKPAKNSYLYGKKYKLVLHVSSYADREVMQKKVNVEDSIFPSAYKMVNDANIQEHIISKFFDLAIKHNFKINVQAKDIWVDYFYWFATDYCQFVLCRVEKAITKEILDKYEKKANIWKITSSGPVIVIFYLTEEAKIFNNKNGITEMIKREYLTAIKDIDEFNLYKTEYIEFDTKENLDKNYGGNLYYYFR